MYQPPDVSSDGVKNLTSFILGAVNGGQGTGAAKPTFGQRLGAGALSAVQGYDKFAEEQNRLNAGGKSADFMRKAMGDDAAQQMGVTDDEWQNMGARDKIAAAQGFQEKQTIAQFMAKTKLMTDEANANDFFANVGSGLAKQINQVPTDPITEQPMTTDPNMTALLAKISPEQRAIIQSIGQAGPGNRGAGQVMVPLVKSLLASPPPGSSVDSTPKFMTGPNGETLAYQPGTKNPFAFSPFTKADSRIREIDAQAQSNSGKGLLPEGTTFSTTANGMAIAELPDGSIKHLGQAPNTAKGKKDFFAQFMGGAAASTNQPTASTTPLPSTSAGALPTATNPKTGEKLILKDGKWQPLK